MAATADAFGGNLIVLDYIQRITPPGEHNDKRGSVDACMNFIRQFADFGVASIGACLGIEFARSSAPAERVSIC